MSPYTLPSLVPPHHSTNGIKFPVTGTFWRNMQTITFSSHQVMAIKTDGFSCIWTIFSMYPPYRAFIGSVRKTIAHTIDYKTMAKHKIFQLPWNHQINSSGDNVVRLHKWFPDCFAQVFVIYVRVTGAIIVRSGLTYWPLWPTEKKKQCNKSGKISNCAICKNFRVALFRYFIQCKESKKNGANCTRIHIIHVALLNVPKRC